MKVEEMIMVIYAVTKAGLQHLGEYTIVSIEKAFDSKIKAETYIKTVPVIWEENINGVKFYCERTITEIEVE